MTEQKKYPWLSDTFKLGLDHQGWISYFWATAKNFDFWHGKDLGPEDTLEEVSFYWDFEKDNVGFTVKWNGEKHNVWGGFIMTYQTLCTGCGRDLPTSMREGLVKDWHADGQSKEELKKIVWDGKPCLCDVCKPKAS